MNKLGLYIHIPFCHSKCFYCDFNSYDNKTTYIKPYMDSLLKELKSKKHILDRYVIKSIFIGGGTPSIVEIDYMKELFEYIKTLNLSKDIEYTIESNPGTLNEEKLRFYLNNGVNRISMGFQAWQDKLLKSIGRIHTKEEFLRNFKCARKVGFKNINVDLMFGLPNQRLDDWKETLENIIELNPEHISTYSLKIEDNTVFAQKYDDDLLNLPTEDEDRKMYEMAKNKLKNNGYIHYEISNFAKTNHESSHNLIYWKNGEYMGVGLGAHSYINKIRSFNERNLKKYISMLKENEDIQNIDECNDLSSHISECMFLGLRLIGGINLDVLNKTYNVNIEKIFKSQIEKLINEKLLEKKGDYLKLTEKGIDLSNQVFMEFL